MIGIEVFAGVRVRQNLDERGRVIVGFPGQQTFEIVGAAFVLGRRDAGPTAHRHQAHRGRAALADVGGGRSGIEKGSQQHFVRPRQRRRHAAHARGGAVDDGSAPKALGSGLKNPVGRVGQVETGDGVFVAGPDQQGVAAQGEAALHIVFQQKTGSSQVDQQGFARKGAEHVDDNG